jgi:hypothetical protein
MTNPIRAVGHDLKFGNRASLLLKRNNFVLSMASFYASREGNRKILKTNNSFAS